MMTPAHASRLAALPLGTIVQGDVEEEAHEPRR